MNIKSDPDKGVVVLSSTSEGEEGVLRSFARSAQDGGTGELKYDGRRGAPVGAPYNQRRFLDFKFGGTSFFISATDDENEKDVRSLRDALFFGHPALIYVIHVEVGGKYHVSACVTRCKVCNAPIIDRPRVEHKICEPCASKCEHVYVTGHLHGGSAGVLGLGEFCTKCGKGNPEVEPVKILDHNDRGSCVVVAV